MLLRGVPRRRPRPAPARRQRRGAHRPLREELSELLGITGIRSSRACFAGRARARSTRSATFSASRRSSDHLARIPGLFVTGSGFRAIGIPDCIADGRATAQRAAAFVSRVHDLDVT